jgi:hypothetical protein
MESALRPWCGSLVETADRGVAGDTGDGSRVDMPSLDVSEGADRYEPGPRKWWKLSLSDDGKGRYVERSWYERA